MLRPRLNVFTFPFFSRTAPILSFLITILIIPANSEALESQRAGRKLRATTRDRELYSERLAPPTREASAHSVIHSTLATVQATSA